MKQASVFSLQDAEKAHDEWGCNCGPAALAAVCGLTLDEVRPCIRDFERKRYTNPTMMRDALDTIRGRFAGINYRLASPDLSWPNYGLARIQWEGPWTALGVPAGARYRHSHWVGSHRSADTGIGIFDVNAMNSGGWIHLRDWEDVLVPWLLRECHPRASGGWHITHAIEVERST
jgi:hypothetical protein